jgi:hypothetical protein
LHSLIYSYLGGGKKNARFFVKEKEEFPKKPLEKQVFKLFEKSFANTGKSFSEALILASTNPDYDKRLFMELP